MLPPFQLKGRSELPASTLLYHLVDMSAYNVLEPGYQWGDWPARQVCQQHCPYCVHRQPDSHTLFAGT